LSSLNRTLKNIGYRKKQEAKYTQ